MVDVHAVAIKINEAVDFARASLGEHLEGHDLMGRFILLSGGNDSTTLAHLAWFVFPSDIRATHAAHANTTIGVEETRVFVRETCAAWGLPLVEKRPPESYRQLVLDPKNGGFPGPARHWKMYTRLKERCLVQVRRDFVKEPRKQRVLFIAGRRRLESKRRANVPENSRDGSIIWTSPLVEWSADDMEAYRTLFAVPHNPVADDLGMSGECLCGAFAEPGEFERLQSLHPDAAQEIVDLEDELVSQNEVLGTLPDEVCHWGWGAYRDDLIGQPVKVGMMCSSCDARHAEGVIPVGGPHEDEGFRARSAARRSKAEDDSALTSMGGSPVSDSTGPVGSKAEDDSALTSMGGSPVSDSTGPVEVVRRLLVMEGPVEYFGGRDTMLASGVDVPC